MKTIITFLLLTVILYADTFNRNSERSFQNFIISERNRFWLGYGVGNSNYGIIQCGSINISISRFLGKIHFSKALYHTHFGTTTETLKKPHLYSASAAGGLGFNYKTLNWGIVLGPMLTWGEDITEEGYENNDDVENLDTILAPGLYGSTHFLFSPSRYFGLGFEATILLSTENFNASLVGTLNLGKFGKPIISNNSDLKICEKRQHITRTMIISGTSLITAGGINLLLGYMGSYEIGSALGYTGASLLLPGIVLHCALHNRIKELESEVTFAPSENGIDLVVKF